MRLEKRLIVFTIMFIVWCLLNWVPDWQHLVIGIFVAAFISYLTADMFVDRPGVFRNPARYDWFTYYIPVFLWQCLKANIDVAYRVIHPDMPINPGIIKVKTNLKSDVALTFLANSITLTPGTLCVDVMREEGILYIHCIDVKTINQEEATRIIVKPFEDILKRIFE